jgi:hypothetical protein
LARPAETEMIPRAAMPPPLAPTLTGSPRAIPGVRSVTPVAAPSFQAAQAVPAAPPAPTAVAAAAPPRPAGISLAARPAGLPRPMPVASAPPVVVPHPPPAAVVHAHGAGAAAVIGGGNCKFHPKTIGRYVCNACNQYFCELCVASRHDGADQHKFCRQCGTELAPVKIKVTYVAPKGFFAHLPGAFLYPVKGSGVLILLITAALFGVLNFFSPPMLYGIVPKIMTWTLMIKVLATGYFFAFMQSIIHATAIGEEEMPSLPSMGNFWEDILLPCLQFVGLTLVCFGPTIAVAWYMIAEGDSALWPALMAAAVFGIFYFPMAFLAVAMLDSIMAANPIQIIPSIFKVPGEYIVTCLLLGFVFSLRPLGEVVIEYIFPSGVGAHDMGRLVAYLAAEAFWGLFRLYLLVVGMRILGLLFFTKRDKLGWLQ